MPVRVLFCLTLWCNLVCAGDPPVRDTLFCDIGMIASEYLAHPDSFFLPATLTAQFKPFHGIRDTAIVHMEKYREEERVLSEKRDWYFVQFPEETEASRRVKDSLDQEYRQSMENAMRDARLDSERYHEAIQTISEQLKPLLQKQLCPRVGRCILVFEGNPEEHPWRNSTPQALEILKTPQ